MKIAGWCFLALFALTSAIHLYHSWTNEHKKRAVTKPMLLLCLIGYYVCSASPLSLVLLFALITSWLGDVLLIPKGNHWFILGGISFLASHILFILVYTQHVDFSSVLWPAVIPAAALYLGVSAAIMFSVRKTTPKPMFVPMLLYLVANSTMNIFALMQLLTVKSTGAVLAYIGAVLFFVSDCTLFLLRYHENKNLIFKKHFTIMLTYLAGEFLITFGMLML
ncbi:MAG: lysoplasmalogenase [Clostridia bacterium]|nr:lysoplasmalogenase [Clostridia bacterium]